MSKPQTFYVISFHDANNAHVAGVTNSQYAYELAIQKDWQGEGSFTEEQICDKYGEDWKTKMGGWISRTGDKGVTKNVMDEDERMKREENQFKGLWEMNGLCWR